MALYPGSTTYPGSATYPDASTSTTGTSTVTLPHLTGSGAGLVPVEGHSTIVLPHLTGAGTAVTYVIGQSAVTLPHLTGAGSALTSDRVTGDAHVTLPHLTGAGYAVTSRVDGTSTVVLPVLTGHGAGTVPNAGVSAVILPHLTGTGAGTTSTDVTGASHVTLPTLTGTGTGLVADLPAPPWTTPTTPPSPAPTTLPVVAAGTAASTLYRHSPQIYTDDFTLDPITGEHVRTGPIEEITGTVGTLHVTIDGVDVTVWEGKPVRPLSWERSQPNGDASCVLDIPQQDPQTTPPSWLHAGAVVEIYLLRPDTTRASKFLGRLERQDLDVRSVGRDGTWSRQWTAAGILTAAMRTMHQPPAVLLPTDIGTLIADALNRVPGRLWHDVPVVTTGILSQRRGSAADKVWTYVQSLLADA